MKTTTTIIPESYHRVTEILKPFSKLDDIDPERLKKAADRGNRVHNFCELYARNLLITDPDEDCKNYISAFIKWFDTMVEDVIMIEERINSSKYKLSGQFDLLAKLKSDSRLTLVDYKTPAFPCKSWALQTAAYATLLEDELGVSDIRRICLMLPKSSDSVKVVEYRDLEHDKKLYFNCYELYLHFNMKS